MNLTYTVDPNHSYRRAIEIAYEKAKREGGVDERTARECELVISAPEPDYIYHEVELDNPPRLLEEGCVSYRELSPWESYEQARLDGRRQAAERVATQVDAIWQDLKKTTAGVDPELLNEISFTIDEKGTIHPVSISRSLDAKAEKTLFEVLNGNSELKKAAEDYIWMLAGLVGRTIEGLPSNYGRHFVHSCLREG